MAAATSTKPEGAHGGGRLTPSASGRVGPCLGPRRGCFGSGYAAHVEISRERGKATVPMNVRLLVGADVRMARRPPFCRERRAKSNAKRKPADVRKMRCKNAELKPDPLTARAGTPRRAGVGRASRRASRKARVGRASPSTGPAARSSPWNSWPRWSAGGVHPPMEFMAVMAGDTGTQAGPVAAGITEAALLRQAERPSTICTTRAACCWPCSPHEKRPVQHGRGVPGGTRGPGGPKKLIGRTRGYGDHTRRCGTTTC